MSCWRPEQRVLWTTAAAAFLAGSFCLLMAFRRAGRPGRWWPWPPAALGLLVLAGWQAAGIG
ncbi:hypothetical protein [Actinoplanes sp. URMC 104]|uniref:hypothetical protein n=1 Tax=Actinoplanes sp. URMC 104 TaxID=3423409 RepID=UPI003F1CCE43